MEITLTASDLHKILKAQYGYETDFNINLRETVDCHCRETHGFDDCRINHDLEGRTVLIWFVADDEEAPRVRMSDKL
jgi:hypothetical protein